MAQSDYVIEANPSGLAMRTEINTIFESILTNNSGSTAPTVPSAFMMWVETSNATYYYLKMRNHDNTAWVTLGTYTVATKTYTSYTNDTIKLTDTVIGSGTQSFNGFGGSGFKNHIINGNFDVWQRGTSFTGLTNGTYSSDRWVVFDTANDINYNIIRNAGVFNAGYGATYSFNSGTEVRSVIQFIENVTRFKVGSNVTISFEAYTSSTPYTVAVAIQGVKGVWASTTGDVTSNIALTNTKTKYSVTLPVPDWTSLGIDWAHLEDTKLALKFNLGANTNGRDFTLGSVQLEEGSTATPFENRPYGLELSLCQRYFSQTGAGSNGFEESTTNLSFGVSYPPMRTTPTATLNSGTVSWRLESGVDRLGIPVSINVAALSNCGGFIYLNDLTSGSASGRQIIERNGANWLNLSAEL